MRRPPAAVAGLLLLAAFITFIAGVALAGSGQFDQALRVLALTTVLLVLGWFLAPRR